MPIYEYQCIDCGKRFELIRTISQADLSTECLNCHGRKTTRVLTTCYARTTGETTSSKSVGGCSGCSGKNCSSCGH